VWFQSGQILSVSVGVHPKVKEEFAARMESVRKGFEGLVIHLEDRVREEPN
jgi:hypothetical protein